MADSQENELNPQRQQPQYEVDKEKLKEKAAKADVLPLYENLTTEYILCKHYSMQTNMYLKSAWSKFKDNYTKVKVPKFLPAESDLHFHNQTVKLRPSESICMGSNFRKTLKTGPGVDDMGDLPIAQDLFSKRSDIQKNEQNKKASNVNKTLKIRH